MLILFGLVVDLTEAQNHLLWEDGVDFVGGMSRRLGRALQTYVLK